MSERHPIIAITGSSGAGTTSVTRTFENIFRREGVNAAIIEGDSFHRFDRKEMKKRAAEAERAGRDAATAGGSGEFDRRTERRQRTRPVGSRIGMREAAANGAATTDGPVGDPARDMAQYVCDPGRQPIAGLRPP